MRFGQAIVRGFSMSPALGDRDRLIVRYGDSYAPGDVIVFSHQGRNDIKRIDHINDSGVFVLGDNDVASLDSRKYGYINPKEILGKAIYRIRPTWGAIPKKGVFSKKRKRGRFFRIFGR